MKKLLIFLNLCLFFGLAWGVRGQVLITDLNQSNTGSYNFGSIVQIATPFETGNSAITVDQIDILMQQYQAVNDLPYVAIYTANGSFLPAVQVSGATFNPQSSLTATMGINTFDPSSPVTLQANTTYDVVVAAHTLDGYWAWGLESGPGGVGPGGQILADASELQNGSWTPLVSGTTFGFDLAGAVPEPSSIALFALGVCVLIRGYVWQRRQNFSPQESSRQ